MWHWSFFFFSRQLLEGPLTMLRFPSVISIADCVPTYEKHGKQGEKMPVTFWKETPAVCDRTLWSTCMQLWISEESQGLWLCRYHKIRSYSTISPPGPCWTNDEAAPNDVSMLPRCCRGLGGDGMQPLGDRAKIKERQQPWRPWQHIGLSVSEIDVAVALKPLHWCEAGSDES